MGAPIKTHFVLHALNLERVQGTSGEPKVSQLDVSCSVDQEVLAAYQPPRKRSKRAHLRLQIPMNVSEFVKLVDTSEHLSSIEASMLLFQDTTVVQQCSKVTSWHVFLLGSAPVPLAQLRLTIARYTCSRSWKA